MNLDSKDRAILRLLRLNARMSHSAIAEEVGLSASACHRRIKNLENDGVIQGYSLVTGMDREDEGVDVVVQVTLDRQTEEFLSRFEQAIRMCPEVRECFLMTGHVDYWLRVRAPSVPAYEAIHGEVLSRLPGVTRISSSIAMRNALSPRRTKTKR